MNNKSFTVFTVTKSKPAEVLFHEIEMTDGMTPALALHHAICHHEHEFDVSHLEISVYVGQPA